MIFASRTPSTDHCIRIWKATTAQLSNKFVIVPCALSLFWHFINTATYHLGLEAFIPFKKRAPCTNQMQAATSVFFKAFKSVKWSLQTFNATDTLLQLINVWPNIQNVDFFESRLKFQIQHSIFRTKVIPPLWLILSWIFTSLNLEE